MLIRIEHALRESPELTPAWVGLDELHLQPRRRRAAELHLAVDTERG